MGITGKDYDAEIASQSIQFQIDHYYEPVEKFWKDRIQRVLNALRPTKGDFILDVGCGVGTFAFHSAKAGADAIGTDFSQEAIDIAKEIVSQYKIPGKVQFMKTDATRLPFEDSSFNKIVSADFFEHINRIQKKKVINEMYRVLKPGGTMVIYTPNRLKLKSDIVGERIKALFKGKDRSRYNWEKYVDSKHIGLTTTFELKRLFKRYNLRIKFKYFMVHIPFISRVFPLLGKFLVTLIPLFRDYFADRVLLVATKPMGGAEEIFERGNLTRMGTD